MERNARFLTAPKILAQGNMVMKGCSQDSNLRNFEAAEATTGGFYETPHIIASCPKIYSVE